MNNQSAWESIFNQFSKKRVLIIGDVMLDAYWWGSVDRISPEAPVPVVLIKNQEYRLGGAANVALNLKRLQATPLLCALIGTDAEGQNFKNLLKNEGIDDSLMVESDERPTTVKTRILGNKSHLLRVDKENGYNLSDSLRERFFQQVQSGIAQADALVFQDYDKGLLDEVLIERIMKAARDKGVPVMVDPKKKNFHAYQNATLFKPNLKELLEGLKLDRPAQLEDSFIEEACDLLVDKLNPEIAMVTLSERGVWITGKEHKHHHIHAYYRDISDVSGAGDTVLAVATLSYLAECSLPEIAWLSNIAGGMVCERVGVVPIEWNDLKYEAFQKLDDISSS